MAAKGRTMLISKQASKHSVALPFFPVKLKTAYFSRRILPVYERVECAFFYFAVKI